MKADRIPVALTIAGSDSGGGAGIQADLKSFSANRCYGASVLTALTAQNTLGVSAIHEVPPQFVTAQIDAVFSDIRVDAVKIGMLANSAVIEAVASGMEKWRPAHIVVDPVMVTTSGDPLIADESVAALTARLFPLASLVTPNLHEAARLTGEAPAASRSEMVAQGRAILSNGPRGVLVKGGHAFAEEADSGAAGRADDVLVRSEGETWFTARRVETHNTHGTGCSLSSAIAANLALGMAMEDAISTAKKWLTGALAASDTLDVGAGSGPVHHFHEMWKQN